MSKKLKVKMLFKKLTSIELERPSEEDYQVMEKIPVVVVLDNVRSQHNIGSAKIYKDS